MPVFPLNKVILVRDASDILNELRQNQYLLECLNHSLDEAYYEADPLAQEWLIKIGAVLRAYDNDRVTERLSTAIALLSEATR
jgi:hypothetical protein